MGFWRNDNDEISGKAYLLIIVLVAFVITGVVLLALSYAQVGYNEYALQQNTITNEIDDTVYEEGLFMIGFWNRLLKFPSTWQTIDFTPSPSASDIPLSAQTKDGLDITIDVSFQYRLNRSTILALYGEFGYDYEQMYVTVSRGELRDAASQWTAVEFFYNRSMVSTALGAVLENKEGTLFCDIGEFQLREITLPTAFETAIQQVVVAQQDIQAALYEQDAARIRAETLIIEAQADANITIIEADATAQALNITLTMEGQALFTFAQTVGFNTTELLTYQWIQAVLTHDESLLIIGADTPIILGT